MTPRFVLGWIVLAGFLIIASDFPATSELALAFAYLILISVLLVAGPDAFNNITTMLQTKEKA
jgi:hypothetical protein